MRKTTIILIFSLLISIIVSNDELKCDGKLIKHCIECDSGQLCAKCEDKYFLYYDNKKCIPCNSTEYEQIGCEGNCEGALDDSHNFFPFCEKDGCKEGYFNVNGMCISCKEFDEGCSRCSYEVPENEYLEEFKCLECESNKYKLTESGKCEECYVNNCEICHYNEDYTMAICDKCLQDTYKDSKGDCVTCEQKDISNGYCYVCTEDETDYDNIFCSCSEGYSLKGDRECIECPENCKDCTYNSETGSKTCLACKKNYVLNSNRECIFCGDGCELCQLDEEINEIKCLSCKIGIILPNNTCPKYIEGCENFLIDDSSENKDEIKCVDCLYDLSPEKHCSSSLSGCYLSIYNEKNDDFDCLQCEVDYYAFITNTLQCFDNWKFDYLDENEKNLFGCVKATYDVTKNDYECLQCGDDYFYVVDNKNCQEKETHDLSFCLEGKIGEEGNYICTKCVKHASLNDNGKCECDKDSFSKDNNYCYKCDDIKEGKYKCLAEKGCTYISPYSDEQLECNECKEGYFEYKKGQCLSCTYIVPNCNKCHFDKEQDQFKCDSCENFYFLDEENNKCLLNECDEYPEIAPGCIICKDKLDEYKPNNKCQLCSYGYFKTKEQSCVYCRSEKYGGPYCYECEYEKDENDEETENIVCKDCFSLIDDNNKQYSINLLSNKKCYNSEYYSEEICLKYDIKKENGVEKKECKVCPLGYYLNSEGKCINYIDEIEIIPNCFRQTFSIMSKFNFYYHPNYITDKITFEKGIKEYISSFNYLNLYLKNINPSTKTSCSSCVSGYFLNYEGKCEIFKEEICTWHFMIDNDERKQGCYYFCSEKGYKFTSIKYKDNLIDIDFENYKNINKDDDIRLLYDIQNIYYDLNYITNNKIKNKILEVPICNSDIKYEGCAKLLYIPKTQSYNCIECEEGYEMNNTDNICMKVDICYKENKGSSFAPRYSCKKCIYSYHTLVTFENGIKDCIYVDELGENCLEGESDYTYERPLFNCTTCKDNYHLIYSEFYNRAICVKDPNEFEEENDFSLQDFENEENTTINEDGTCPENYFTPDGKFCYKCDNEIVGMPGCAGACNFSSKRKNMVICEGNCKKGYIQTSKGICEKCSEIDSTCVECHYEEINNRPIDYKGIAKSRIFKCDSCKDNIIPETNGKCNPYYIRGDCAKSVFDEETQNFKCIECYSKYHIVGKYDTCDLCVGYEAVVNGKCIECSDVNQGGISNCNFCENNENANGIICKECFDDFILLTDNNTCLKREGNDELKKFNPCLELKTENGKLVCIRCKIDFSLLTTEDNNKICIHTPTLYDSNFKNYYLYHYYVDIFENNIDEFYNFFINDYNHKRVNYFPCKESINLGTTENPIYSCTKCYYVFEKQDHDDSYYSSRIYEYNKNSLDISREMFETYYVNPYSPLRIIDTTKNNISYCYSSHDISNDCIEAVYTISNSQEIYNCTKCKTNFSLYYNPELDTNYCLENYNSEEFECVVDLCSQCADNNKYFCTSCKDFNYEVNKYNGACVLSTETVPSITWKDVFRLNLNGKKEINGQIISGPSLILRGITSSQINQRHAFLVRLTFKLKYGLRNLQDEISIPAICQIENEVQKNDTDVNIVDYECIGNSTINEDYKLFNIEEDDDDNNDVIKNSGFSNLNEIITDAFNKVEDLSQKLSSSFTNTDNIIIFILDEEEQKQLYSNNHKFNLTLNGKINKDTSLSQKTLYDAEVEMFNITDKPKSTFYLGDNRKARLNIFLELKTDIDKSNIYIKNNEIKVDNKYFVYVPTLNEVELVNDYIDGEEEEDDNDSSKKKLIKIIIIVIIGVVVLAGIVIMIICISRKKKSPHNVNLDNFEGQNNNGVIRTFNYNNNNIIQTEQKRVNI